MATRKPLVIGDDGLPQQLQAADTINVASAQYSSRAVTNGEGAAAVVIGAPVYASAADTVKRGQANAGATSRIIGLGLDVTIASGASGNIITDGTLVATAAQWDAVAGSIGGLAFGMPYFLDAANPGKITNVAPTTAGQYNMLIGVALSATELELHIDQPILL